MHLKSGLIRVVALGESGLWWEWPLVGVVFGGSGLWWEWVRVAFGGSGLWWEWPLVGVAFGGSDLIKGRLLYIKNK